MSQKTIKIFVPAQALEHHTNSEYATLRDKLRAAIVRYHLSDDFFGFVAIRDPMPFVDLQAIKFESGALGYSVRALIKSG